MAAGEPPHPPHSPPPPAASTPPASPRRKPASSPRAAPPASVRLPSPVIAPGQRCVPAPLPRHPSPPAALAEPPRSADLAAAPVRRGAPEAPASDRPARSRPFFPKRRKLLSKYEPPLRSPLQISPPLDPFPSSEVLLPPKNLRMAVIHPSTLLATLLLLVSISSSSATNHTVGDALGWTTRVDYSAWTVGKTFFIGDNLVFNYPPGIHTVNEVSAGDYIACSAMNYKSTDSSGATVITLTVGGPHYFICSIPGHCTDGMKLFVTVQPPTGTNIPGDSFFPTSDTPGDSFFPTSNDIPFMPSAANGILMSASWAVLLSAGMVVLMQWFF